MKKILVAFTAGALLLVGCGQKAFSKEEVEDMAYTIEYNEVIDDIQIIAEEKVSEVKSSGSSGGASSYNSDGVTSCNYGYGSGMSILMEVTSVEGKVTGLSANYIIDVGMVIDEESQ